MNLETCAWDPDLCNLFEIPMEILPKIRPITAHFGLVKSKGKDIPISASVVDQQAALMGRACYTTGQIKVTFGTGCFALIGSGLIKQLSDLPPAKEPKAIISPQQDITRLKQGFGEAVMRSRNWRQ